MFELQMMPPHWIPSATAHLAHISAASAASSSSGGGGGSGGGGSSAGSDKRSPPPEPSSPAPTPPTPPVSHSHPPSDPDIPLNLTKPKSNSSGSGSGSAGSSPHGQHHSGMGMPGQGPSEQPVAATTPKLLPPNIVMPRAFMPYAAGLPPHLSPMPPGGGDRHKMQGNKDMMSPDKQPHFSMHMYGLPGPPHLTGSKQHRDESAAAKEEADFMAACNNSKYS